MKTLAFIVCTLGLCLTLFGMHLQPEIAAPKTQFKYSPTTTPTGYPGPTPSVDKTTLIIQQNWMCWIGAPGATCGPERTYV